MNKKNIVLAFTMGLSFANGVFAIDPKAEKEEFDINSVVYIEEETKIELGFDTADYLPENFDPYKAYVDLNSVAFVEGEFTISKRMQRKLAKRLPAGFDAYAYPTAIRSIDYIDENDTVVFDFDAEQYLPEGFNAYSK